MQPLRIYLIDDDDDDSLFFCQVLDEISEQIECVTFSNGQEAIQTLQSAATPPDYIFLDLNMPRFNGRQCLEQIRKHKALSHIPVIMYTTSKLTQDITDTRNLGADHFITKPTDLNKLKKELEFVLQNKWKD